MDGLKLLVAKGPSAPPKLTPQQQAEVQARLKTGESFDGIARSYGVERRHDPAAGTNKPLKVLA